MSHKRINDINFFHLKNLFSTMEMVPMLDRAKILNRWISLKGLYLKLYQDFL